GTWKARCDIRRMRYRVEPGLYAVGRPTAESPVLVSANYKLSFDRLRSQLGGIDAWILVLDTRGVNVWCAAGKGTFGTDEIVRRAEAVGLSNVVSHRQLVVPQLGAPGVCAHEVKRRCRFRVIYGPVRAEDLPAFLSAGMKATPQMRRVEFPLRDRLVLIPADLVLGARHAWYIAACFLLLAGLGPGVYSVDRALTVGLRSAGLFLAVAMAGIALTPALLPWLPGRSFSAKGAWVGLVLALAVGGYAWTHPEILENRLSGAAWLLIIPAVASFVGMNFTGSSTYTSLSGVRREMRVAVPAQVACAVMGAGLWLVGRFV
ncbi:MAG: mercury methylation corrinoid protein HgcA, partial [Planctomycetota bacterium]